MDADALFKKDLIAMIPHMRAFARSLCRDATQGDDLAQEALAKAWANRNSFEPGTNLKGWTFMIVRNQFYSDKRRSWRQQSLDPEVAERTLVAVDNPTSAIELDEARRALACLPDEQREALILIAVAGLSYEEAAGICGAAVGTIKSRVSRARDRLAAIISEGSFADDGRPVGEAMASMVREAALLSGRAAA